VKFADWLISLFVDFVILKMRSIFLPALLFQKRLTVFSANPFFAKQQKRSFSLCVLEPLWQTVFCEAKTKPRLAFQKKRLTVFSASNRFVKQNQQQSFSLCVLESLWQIPFLQSKNKTSPYLLKKMPYRPCL
jgi:hypothetical protein